MRCTEHPDDDSSSVGLCASCLRERLFAVLVAQMHCVRDNGNRISDAQAQRMPLLFPRSVSTSRLKPDEDRPSRSRPLRFRATPHVGPEITSYTDASHGNKLSSCNSLQKKNSVASSLFSRILRFRSTPDMREESTSSSSPASWLAMIFPGSIKKKPCGMRHSMKYSAERKSNRRAGDGPSPLRVADSDRERSCEFQSPLEIGYTSAEWSANGRRRRTVALAPASTSHRAKAGHKKSSSSMAFCLSPLVRASPNSHWNKVGSLADAGISSEFRVRRESNFYAAGPSFANRSRKLADFGKSDRNR